MFASWEFSGATFDEGSKTIGPFYTHYSFMNSQEESLTRRLPVQLVVYMIHMRILHSGLTAAQVLALPPEKFGCFMGQCYQVTRDAQFVPYQADEAPALQCSMTGKLTLGLRGTEDMVSSIFS